MSDLLEAAASALGTPSSLVQRAAAARASASGATVEEILAAWSGGAPAPAPTPAPAADPTATAASPEPAPAQVAVLDPPPIALPTAPEPVVYEYVEEVEPLEPVAIGTRLRTAVRVGAWTGAALGLVGFLAAAAFWAPGATIDADGRAMVEVTTTGALIGLGLVSIVFGAIVASLSCAAASWRDPAMQLSGKRSTTGWIGAGIGLILGVAASALLTGGFGTPVEGVEGVVHLPVLATLGVMLVGGSVLGAVTAGVPQIFGTPVSVDPHDVDEVATVRTRLGQAVTVPLIGALMLAVFVLPFAFLLLQANELVHGVGAAIVAIIAAGGILGFSALAGSKPNMKITFGEALVAAIGIGTVLLVIISVLVFRS